MEPGIKGARLTGIIGLAIIGPGIIGPKMTGIRNRSDRNQELKVRSGVAGNSH